MRATPAFFLPRIYVPIPKVTREHRERLAKGVKAKLNETKDNLRRVQNK